jgi:iron complex outermembrane recepter protein
MDYRLHYSSGARGTLRRSLLAGVAALACGAPALAQSASEPNATGLPELIVTGRPSPTMALPVAVANDSVERSQLDATNLTNADDALRYAANFQIRKRYLGDQNGSPAARATTGPQSARTLVLVDGIPISNLLGSGFAFSPRWGMIAPDEIESVDIMYGPYSALYSGNTLGAGVFFTTRMPREFEASVGTLGGYQRFHGYETEHDLTSWQLDASIGDRRGDFAWAIYANTFDVEGQPGNFLTVPVANGSTTLAGTPVTGGIRQIDSAGIDRWLFGSTGIFNDKASLLKGKAEWNIDDSTRLFVTAAFRDHFSDIRDPDTYLRNAAGQEIRSGRVSMGGRSFSLDNLGLAIQRQITNTEDVLYGATLQKRFSPSLALEASVSRFDILAADQRTSYVFQDPAGQINVTDDQGWQNAALRMVWEPSTFLQRAVIGGDYADYWTQNSVYASPNFRAGAQGALSERNRGQAQLAALFTEARFALADNLDLTAGLRWEDWKASDGLRVSGALSLTYPERSESHLSPKVILTWRPAENWSLEARAAEAYRFPTVAELFQSRSTGGALIQSDPNLKPEHAKDVDISVTRQFAFASGQRGKMTVSLYRENIRDVLFNQFNAFTLATYNQNVDRVSTQGVEAYAALFGMMDGKFDLDFSLSHQSSEIKANAGQPATVGKEFPRIPNWRGKLLATYRPLDRLSASVGLRYEGKQYNDLLNTDDRSGGFGYMSEYLMVDVKAQYQVNDNLTASIGVDNLTDRAAYYFHPFPMRTVFASLRWRH